MTAWTEHRRPSGDLEGVFRERTAPDEEIAALFHISISRTKGSKIRVEVDATLDEEAIGRLVDADKVRLMRLQRQQLQDQLQEVPFDDGYRVKPRRALSAAELDPRPKSKVLTKHAHNKVGGDAGSAARVQKKEVIPGLLSDSQVKAAQEKAAERKARLDRLAKSDKTSKSDSALARMKQKEEEERKKNQLPDFAKPFIKLRDIVPNSDWTRPAPPRFHGLHMHTKCFQKRERVPQWCEKVPVFQKFLSQAEALNGGALSKHVQRRSQLYDGMCQELMRLEDHQVKKPKVYSPRKTNCYDCQRFVNAAEGVFFKTSHTDFERNAIHAEQPPANSRKQF